MLLLERMLLRMLLRMPLLNAALECCWRIPVLWMLL